MELISGACGQILLNILWNTIQYVSLVECKAQLLNKLWDRERPGPRFWRMVVFLEKTQKPRETLSAMNMSQLMASKSMCTPSIEQASIR